MYELIKSYLNKFDCLGIVGDNDCFNILSHEADMIMGNYFQTKMCFGDKFIYWFHDNPHIGEAVRGIKDNKDIQVLLVTDEMSKDRQGYYASLGLITEIFYG